VDIEYKYYCAYCGEPLPYKEGEYVISIYSYGDISIDLATWNKYGQTILPYYALEWVPNEEFKYALTFCNNKCAMLFKLRRY
jgi:ribosomal protein L24E